MLYPQKLLTTALSAARAAAKLQQSSYGKTHTRHAKISHDFYTEVDLNSEKIILKTLRSAYPNHTFLAEETLSSSDLSAEWCWIIDPLDGTHCFENQIPFFGPSIALLHNSTPILGVCIFPMLKEEYTALQGHGAFLNNQPLKITDQKDFEGTQLVGSNQALIHAHQNNFYHLFASAFVVPCLLEHARRFLSGLVPVSLSSRSHYVWDMAAMDFIVRTAGGHSTTWQGKPITYNNIHTQEGICFSTPATFKKFISLMQQNEN